MTDQTVATIHLPDGMALKGSHSRLHFYTSVGLMTTAGIPVHQAVEFVGNSSPEATLREFCEKALARMDAGATLAFIVKQFPNCFPPSAYRSMRAGEMAGTLPDALLALARMEERRLVAHNRLRSALMYPGFVVLLALVLMIAPALLFGDVVVVLGELGVQVPGYTRAVLRASELAGSPWVWLGLVLLGLFFYQELTEERAQARFQKWVRLAWSKVPGFSQLITLWSNLHFCQSLALLTEVGLPLTEAVSVSMSVSNDPIMEKARETVVADITNGVSLADALRDSGLILPFVITFVQTGEESGELPESLRKAATYLDTVFQARTEALMELMQPVLLLATGLLVGAVAIGTLKPLSELLVL
jgi:type IV pilus assembly protein PilC